MKMPLEILILVEMHIILNILIQSKAANTLIGILCFYMSGFSEYCQKT